VISAALRLWIASEGGNTQEVCFTLCSMCRASAAAWKKSNLPHSRVRSACAWSCRLALASSDSHASAYEARPEGRGSLQAEIHQAFVDYQSGRLQSPNDDVWAAA